MLFLVLSYLTAHAHALCEDVHHLVVELVDLLAQLADALGGDGVVAYDEEREDIVEHIGCHLLLGVAPCLVGVAVALDD